MTRGGGVRSAVGRAVSLAVLGCASPGFATAQESEQEPGETLEEVIVTGSRIPRRDFRSTSPVTTVDSLELKLAGITNVEDSLNALPQVVPSFDRSMNGAGDNTATVNLRGLGENRSLSLLNGRRIAASGSFGAIDLNNIPSALIERIEVVSGGASAVYGSDALTGAINFILKKDFEGVEVTSQYDVTEAGDGEVIDINVSAGTSFAAGRGYLSGFVNVHDRRPIFHADRPFTQEVLFDDIFTGEVFSAGSSAVPAGTILNPVDVGGVFAEDGFTFEQDGTPRPFLDPEDRFNYAPFNYLQMPLERTVAAAFVDFDIGLTTRFYGEYTFADTSQEAEFAPSALFFEPIQMNIDNPFIHPATGQIFEENFDPDGDGIADFFLAKRLPELGSRNIDRTTELHRYVSGIEADIFGDWLFDLNYSFTDSQGRLLRSNDGSRTRFHQTLLVDPATQECWDPTGGCAPANIFGEGTISPEAADFIRTPPLGSSADVTQAIIGSSVVGDFTALPAGDLGFAIGVEFRKDKYDEAADNDFSNEDQMGFFAAIPISGEVKLKEVYAEVLLPILSDKRFARYLAVEGGYRYTDHSLAGGFDTWKLSAEWEPFTGYTLRGSIQQAVRAPNAIEYFEAEIADIDFFVSEFADLCSASLNPELAGFTEICVAQGIPASEIGTYEATLFYPTLVTTGGNQLLDPEVSDTVTAGIVIQPDAMPNLQVSLDYYSIDIDNAIQYIDPFQTIILCFAIQIPEDPLCQAVERDPDNYNISAVTGGPRNIATLRTRGYDLQINYEHDLPTWLSIFDGDTTLSYRILANHALENGSQPTPDVRYRDCAGFIGFPCNVTSFGTLPAYKTNTRVTYDSGPLTFSIQWLWIDGMKDAFFEYGLDLFGRVISTFRSTGRSTTVGKSTVASIILRTHNRPCSPAHRPTRIQIPPSMTSMDGLTSSALRDDSGTSFPAQRSAVRKSLPSAARLQNRDCHCRRHRERSCVRELAGPLAFP
jgi:outer membrane receptor protein involved in Fe transport